MHELPPVVFYGLWILSIAIQLALAAGIVLQVVELLKGLPVERRQIAPGLVWLLLVPAFCVVWIWFVLIQLVRSFQPKSPANKGPLQFALLAAGVFTVLYWFAPTWAWVALLFFFISLRKKLKAALPVRPAE